MRDRAYTYIVFKVRLKFRGSVIRGRYWPERKRTCSVTIERLYCPMTVMVTTRQTEFSFILTPSVVVHGVTMSTLFISLFDIQSIFII
jgi:hypothetical protein